MAKCPNCGEPCFGWHEGYRDGLDERHKAEWAEEELMAENKRLAEEVERLKHKFAMSETLVGVMTRKYEQLRKLCAERPKRVLTDFGAVAPEFTQWVVDIDAAGRGEEG